MNENEPCQFCGHRGPHELRPNDTLPGRFLVYCAGCKKNMGWKSLPENERAKRPPAHRDLVRKYGRGFCELCLRMEAELPERHRLIGHHVIEYQDEGPPLRENVWIVCAGCSALIHLIRTYFALKETTAEGK